MINEKLFTAEKYYENQLHGERKLEEPKTCRLAQYYAIDIPQFLQPIEENTVPSFLWRHKAKQAGKATSESSDLEVYQRLASAAAYAGWQKNLFADEREAQIFRDETIYLLTHSFLVLDPKIIKYSGLDWAYGQISTGKKKQLGTRFNASPQVKGQHFYRDHTKGLFGSDLTFCGLLNNKFMDSVIASNPKAVQQWADILQNNEGPQCRSLRFTNTISEWTVCPQADTQEYKAQLDLSGFKRANKTIHGPALQQATRIAVLLLDLLTTPIHSDRSLPSSPPEKSFALSLGNLPRLLTDCGFEDHSHAAHSSAAAICAIISAEAHLTLAELAAKCGRAQTFNQNRSDILRVLQNKRRTAYGEESDYDNLSILPMALRLQDGASLPLIALARYGWDKAVQATLLYGLGHSCKILTNADTFAFASPAEHQSTRPAFETAKKTLAMAAAMQPFVSTIFTPVLHPAEKFTVSETEQLVLFAWQAGIHGLSFLNPPAQKPALQNLLLSQASHNPNSTTVPNTLTAPSNLVLQQNLKPTGKCWPANSFELSAERSHTRQMRPALASKTKAQSQHKALSRPCPSVNAQILSGTQRPNTNTAVTHTVGANTLDTNPKTSAKNTKKRVASTNPPKK